MISHNQNRFSPRELRWLYFSLLGIIGVALAMLYGLGVWEKGKGRSIIYVRELMLHSWWMVVVGAMTYGVTYMIVAFITALRKGCPQPLKPDWHAVFVLAVVFALIRSFRLAYGENLLHDFAVIFLKEFLGIVLISALTSPRRVRELMYR